MFRTLAIATATTAIVAVALVARAGDYLLGFGAPHPPGAQVAAGPLSELGPQPVGVRALADGTVWYPAEASGDGGTTYGYVLNVAGPDAPLTIATFEGVARPAALPNRSDAPYPTVLLSHGYAIPASGYAWLGEHLASHGFVVVAPDHGDSLDPSSLWRSTVERVDSLAGGLGILGHLAGLADTTRMAAVGHSYGGFAALAAGGARLDTAGFDEACAVGDQIAFLCDALVPRWPDIAAAAGLDATPTGVWPTRWSVAGVEAVVSIAGDAAMFAGAGLDGLTVPVMTIGGTADVDSPFEWGTRYVFEAAAAERKAEVALDGAGHLAFAGPCERERRIVALVPLGMCDDPGWEREAVRSVTKHYVTAFLLAELTDDDRAASHLGPAHRPPVGVTYRSEGY